MTGALWNGALILLGGMVGLALGQALSNRATTFLRLMLLVAAMAIGVNLIYRNLSGDGFAMVRQGIIGLFSLSAGSLLGRWMGLQKRYELWLRQRIAHLNSVGAGSDPGRVEKDELDSAASEPSARMKVVRLETMMLWFLVSPVAVLGILQQGLADDWRILAIKGVMDATAAWVWAWTSPVRVAAAAVFTTLVLSTGAAGVRWVEPWLAENGVVEGLGVVSGLLMLLVAMTGIGWRRAALVNALPALLIVPWPWYFWS